MARLPQKLDRANLRNEAGLAGKTGAHLAGGGGKETMNGPTKDDIDQYWRLIAEIQRRDTLNSDAFDKAILTLSSGALALSLTFLKDVVPLHLADASCLLYVSWFGFAACIICTVASFLFGPTSTRLQSDIAKDILLEGKPVDQIRSNWANNVIGHINFVSGLLFCLSMMVTVLFVSLNAEHAVMTDDRDLIRKAQGMPPVQRIPQPAPAQQPPASKEPASPPPSKAPK